jgi:hypothetical protein
MVKETIQGDARGTYVGLDSSPCQNHGMAYRARAPRPRSPRSSPRAGKPSTWRRGTGVLTVKHSVRYARCEQPNLCWRSSGNAGSATQTAVRRVPSGAPRWAPMNPYRREARLKERPWGQPPYPNPKGGRDNSMAETSKAPEDVDGADRQDPRDMEKATLPEPQHPGSNTRQSALRLTPIPEGSPGRVVEPDTPSPPGHRLMKSGKGANEAPASRSDVHR